MDNMIKIYVNRTDANSESFILTEYLVKNEAYVEKDEIIAEAETSKAVFEIRSPGQGYFCRALIKKDVNINYETPIGMLFDNRDHCVQYLQKRSIELPDLKSKVAQKITNKAQALIEKHKIDIDKIDVEGIIREKDILQMLSNVKSDYDEDGQGKRTISMIDEVTNPIILIGPGSGAASILESLENQYSLVAVVGEIPNSILLKCGNVFPDDEYFLEFIRNNTDIAEKITLFANVGVNMGKLKKIVSSYKEYAFQFCNAIHPKATISKSATIGVGNYIGPNVTIGPGSAIGDFNWIAAHVNIDHHNTIGNFNLLGPGVMLSGNCSVGNENIVAAGTLMQNRTKIENGNVLALGSKIVP